MPQVLQDLQTVVPAPWVHLILVAVSLLCGAIIGAERTRREKPAGLRTLAMVCLGATVFTLTSYAFTTSTGDSGRVAAQIVTGIGFLGGGVILRHQSNVTGTTTAATIWVTAAVGIAVGTGHAAGGIALSLLIRGVLAGLYHWESLPLGSVALSTIELRFDPDHGKTRIHLEKLFEDYHVEQRVLESEREADATVCTQVSFRLRRRHLRELLDEIASLPSILEIREIETGRPARKS